MKKAIFSISKIVLALSSVLGVSQIALADSGSSVTNAVAEGTVKINMRARYENVDQDNASKDANAGTLRTRLTYRTADFKGFNVLAEVDNVTATGQYNSTDNGKGAYSVVADPEGTDVNQISLNYKNGGLKATFGRQRILHNGQRFVGGVGWRQNEQTYDGYRLQYAVNKSLNFDYSYIYNINRIFGNSSGKPDMRGAFQLATVNYKFNKAHKITGFVYDLDYDMSANSSTQTLGFDYNGKFGGLKLHASYASQSDTADSLKDFSADYYALDASFKVSSITLKAGIESLGSDNGVAFSTPLATLHKFQGFADLFLGTPSAGIEDIFAGIATKIGPVAVSATYHDFSSDVDSIDYGSEIDLTAKYKFSKKVTGLIKYADYSADDHGVDTSKLWLMVNVNF
ncbi:alginate export family protein [Pseudoalteromonas denitrificans]|uniref:Alginate export n=1 Tax=Pseudoalteromonas denitrificans DSM 6059 TaxID=1123010 RepID=A0A1I1H092_9GAMM|nr:alginate export family protein [Pseudoalteromonas denitrificans]SFC16962.1 Alginate export [Pseudoalteromonas denitrificans DSM 6059]